MRALPLNGGIGTSAVLACVLTLGRGQPSYAQTGRDTIAARVDSVFADVNRTGSPGCSLGVIRDGALIYSRGYGMANLDDDIALSPSSAFYIASTSKQFTAASVLLLAQEGKITLDDNVRKYIPELPDYGTPITVRELLHHTSGIRDYLGLLGMGAGRAENVMSDDDIIALIARQKALNFPPGSEYSYSNSGYFLLGQIVKRVTGTSLREYAESRIFRPLGMLHTQFHDDRLRTIRHRVIGYDPSGSGFDIDYFGNFQGVGDGGLWSTVEDLALWDRNFYDPRVGGAALVREQLTPGRLTSGDTITYATGLMLGSYRGLATVSHGGAFMGYRSEFLRFPAQRFSVICLCNLSTSNPTARADKVADIYLARDFPAVVASSESAAKEYHVELAASTLNAFAGSYRNAATGMVWQLANQSGHLTTSTFGIPIELAPITSTHFHAIHAPIAIDVVFESAAAGHPSRMSVTVGDDAKPDVYERIDAVVPTRARLAEYAGTYESSELGASYLMTVSGDSLYVAVPQGPKYALVPTIRDAFLLRGTAFTFLRDRGGRLTGLTVWTPQARNIHFDRRETTERH
jgi:CubicO group peptidase (beta-lactamase class C family)